ncbi:MAG TPA: class I SAM-dependent methyltransferase [Anaerolineales bacterium]|nr:class I SAM-dependent methyltransferase [Anaerolineales bacterium]HLO33327.1 class I SAM-dependent methyltransferase [Anaerolineales bacterium]
METIRGRKSLQLDFNGLQERLAYHTRVVLDLGTGDGRYVRTLAERNPDWFVIGVDACRENLRDHSQAKLKNILFVIANAQDLPKELNGLASHITINFPWGSLLEDLLAGNMKMLNGLASVSQPRPSIDIHLNGGALAEAKTTLEAGAEKIYDNLRQAGWRVKAPMMMDVNFLRSFPTTWAKRLAYGRDPRAVTLSGCFK